MTKYLLVLAIGCLAILTPPLSVFAADGNGACSWHNGVNCDAGADWNDGSVICNDGWTNSTVTYREVCTDKIIPVYTCYDYYKVRTAVRKIKNIELLTRLSERYLLNEIESSMNDRFVLMASCPTVYKGYILTPKDGGGTPFDCTEYSTYNPATKLCQCNDNFFAKDDKCVYGQEICSGYDNYKRCYCAEGGVFDKSTNRCVNLVEQAQTETITVASAQVAQISQGAPKLEEPVKIETQKDDKWLELQKSLLTKQDVKLTSSLAGRILLQTQGHGEAWYLDPITQRRYYLKDGQAAYQALRSFGLGITNIDLEKLKKGDKMLLLKMKGRILLQVQAHGEAYYVHPVTGGVYYMKDGAEAYRLMRELSLGVTNKDIYQIPIGDVILK